MPQIQLGLGVDSTETIINVIKMFALFLLMVQLVPLLVWVERRGSAFIQNRYGPNRVGPLGLLQLLADAVKFLFKEEFRPKKGVAFMYYFAPVMALLPGALSFASIPLSVPIVLKGENWGPYNFVLQGYDLGIGIVFILGISSLGVYSLLMAGWGSSNKYSLMGALRASAQAISYELALSLSLVGILMVYGTFSFTEIVAQQQGPLTFNFMGTQQVWNWLPNWGIFFQPLGALLFFAATFAEANRLPFDLPEAEGELVAGFHTEYAGFKLLMFYIGEYGHMLVASCLLATFYFGGYNIPGVTPAEVTAFFAGFVGEGNLSQILTAVTYHVSLLLRVLLFLWIFIHVRWTLPRFRYDQLMDLGWKTMLPWALFNACATAVILWLFQK
ncbi:MAG TPA: NADH-quinone oxidoreductase subunit H [Pseudobdellovibrionaceae bacterium]|nr:NADH-quinone oxidoreductase subunit H [Pseudobdellovibrionaceae bacterium]